MGNPRVPPKQSATSGCFTTPILRTALQRSKSQFRLLSMALPMPWRTIRDGEREIEGGRGTWVCGSKEYIEKVVT